MIAMLRRRKNTFVDPNIFTFRVTKNGKKVITGITYPEDYNAPVIVIPKGVYVDFLVNIDIPYGDNLKILDFNNTPVIPGASCFTVILSKSNFNYTEVRNLPTGVEEYDFMSPVNNFVNFPNGTKRAHNFYVDSNITQSGEFPKSFRDFIGIYANSRLEMPCRVIPEGVSSIEFICSGCSNLEETIPQLPSTLKSMDQAYFDCKKIRETGNIPNNVSSMNGTYINCVRLSKINNLPNELISMKETFVDTNIELIPTIPEKVTDMSGCFSSCGKIKSMPVLPKSLKIMQGTFRWCSNLVVATQIPDGVFNTAEAFLSCVSLKRVKNLPKSLLNMDSMFQGCSNLMSSPDLPDAVETANSAYSGCINMAIPPKLNNNLKSAISMFEDCERLLVFPVLPKSLIEAQNIFANTPFAGGDLIILSKDIRDVHNLGSLIGHNKDNPIDIYCMEDTYLFSNFKRDMAAYPNVHVYPLQKHPDFKKFRKEYEIYGI